MRSIHAQSSGDRLEDHRLSGLCRGDHQCTLALAQGAEQIDDAVGVIVLAVAAAALEPKLLVRVYGAEPAELRAASNRLERLSLHGGDGFQGRSSALAATSDRPLDLVPNSETVLADEAFGHVNIAVGREVARVPAPQEATSSAREVEDAEH